MIAADDSASPCGHPRLSRNGQSSVERARSRISRCAAAARPETGLTQLGLEQPATAIYFNPNGALVIRQKADYPDDDPFVYIGADHIEAFLEKLCDVCGVKSFP
jgi:hypothetical protein